MLNLNNRLAENDPEDVGEVLLKIYDSLKIEPHYNDFEDAKTYGDLCDAILSRIPFDDVSNCAAQQAFYKVRNAIALTQPIEKSDLHPQTPIYSIFPRKGRRKKLKAMFEKLGCESDLLSMKKWVFWSLLLGFAISMAAFFVSGTIAMIGLFIFTAVTYVANKFNNEMEPQTLGKLTKLLVRAHYMHLRNAGTVNKKEVLQLIDEMFMQELGLEKEALQRDSVIGW